MHTLLIISALILTLGACYVCSFLHRYTRDARSRQLVQMAGLMIPSVTLSFLVALAFHFYLQLCYWTSAHTPLSPDVAVAQTLSVVGVSIILLCVLLNLVRSLLLVWHLKRRTWEAPDWLQNSTNQLVIRAGLRHLPQIRVSNDERPWALTTGIVRPCLVVSKGLITLLDAEELDAVLYHEIVHVRRGDTWRKVLFGFLRDLSWFTPHTRRLYGSMLAEQEVACDDGVHGEPRRLALASALAHIWQANSNVQSHGTLDHWSKEQSQLTETRINRLLSPAYADREMPKPTVHAVTFVLAFLMLLAQIGVSFLTLHLT